MMRRAKLGKKQAKKDVFSFLEKTDYQKKWGAQKV